MVEQIGPPVRALDWNVVPVELLARVAVEVVLRHEGRALYAARPCPCCGEFVHTPACALAECVRLASGD